MIVIGNNATRELILGLTDEEMMKLISGAVVSSIAESRLVGDVRLVYGENNTALIERLESLGVRLGEEWKKSLRDGEAGT
jgi:hypothetical protein